MKRLYPLLFQPNLHTVVWGGDRICGYKGLDMQQKNIGESWEVSAVPTSKSIVSNGELAGRDLVSVVDEAPDEILGKAVSEKYNGQLPLLVKFIDSAKPLSIQVHPNDEMARREHGKSGKTEMWYVIDAQPGSFLYAGFKQEITPEEYKRRIADGTITDVLAKHEVKRGDVFYLPAGRVHAIGSGILLCEVQQSSDVTYRIYDYNRPGLDGKPRELHTELAARALNFHVEEEYRTIYRDETNSANLIIDSPYFSVRVSSVTHPFHRNLLKYDSFVICVCMRGDCKIKMRATGDEIVLRSGNSCLIPAAIADYDVVPLDGSSTILDAFIDNMDRSVGHMITRFLHLSSR
ncbi:MAG: class I mannose-6-phosphate isomerase [Prevotella sp.]|nr:class I mannose-6-phosphate isomerase [Prevotella sp.]MDD7046637.1 mannose-6-phosphate isomerase [Prevotella sp.]MDY5546870.1 type I phosphomannose isomerase catalytic subunit [Prevotella sp.]